jgi:hypothetical protein
LLFSPRLAPKISDLFLDRFLRPVLGIVLRESLLQLLRQTGIIGYQRPITFHQIARVHK